MVLKSFLIGLLVVLCLILSAGIYVFYGLAPIPTPKPIQSNLYDQGFMDAAEAADQIVTSARAELGAPSFSAAVARNGKLVWAGAAGWQDIGGKISATPATRYRIGSTSKTITTTVLARLVDKGVINLDEHIGSYAANLPDKWLALTPRQLMSHTAGIVGYDENRDLQGMYQTLRLQKRYTDLADTLETIDDSDLMYPPGTAFLYSSFDVNLMSVVMQNATGTAFLELVEQEVTTPLSLSNTYGDNPARRDEYEARFYEVINGEAKPWRDVDLSVKTAGGGFISRPTDMVLLASAWLDNSFIASATRTIFWEPQRLTSGEVNEQNYALGWRADETRIGGKTYQRLHHGGVAKGAMNWLVLYPELGISVNISINTIVDSFATFAAYEKRLTEAFIANEL
jgi:CubicO group peptidase (beta-lactamase class C family)